MKTNKLFTINLVTPKTSDKESSEMIKCRKNISDVMEKYSDVLGRIKEEMNAYNRLVTLQNPPLYFSYIPSNRNDGKYNLTVKTFFPLPNGKKKEIRLYMGTREQYPNHKLEYVKQLGKTMMKQHLKEKYEI